MTPTARPPAHPVRNAETDPPEITTGAFSGAKSFRVWFNQFSDCEDETGPSVAMAVVANTGTTLIKINGATVAAGGSPSVAVPNQRYATGNQSGYTGETTIAVTCGAGMMLRTQ